MLGWILFAAASAAAGFLAVRLLLLRHDLRQLGQDTQRLLSENTNQPLTTQSGDSALRSLTVRLNGALRELRRRQIRYETGDRELKTAVTNISHDLRTPLTAITGYLELMHSQPQSAETAKHLAVIAERTEQMRTLTEELFRYSLILSEEDSTPPAPVSINAILEESIAAYYAALTQRGITPEITMPEQPVICICSKTALSRIFSNLLNNALKYSDGDLTVTLTEEGSVSFANHAGSIRQTDLEHLFDRFYTVENAQHSTGLGLAIARAAARQMNGGLTAECSDGILRILLTLPVTAETT